MNEPEAVWSPLPDRLFPETVQLIEKCDPGLMQFYPLAQKGINSITAVTTSDDGYIVMGIRNHDRTFTTSVYIGKKLKVHKTLITYTEVHTKKVASIFKGVLN